MDKNPIEELSRDERQMIETLLTHQGLGVLATKDRGGHPYASLIAFAPSPDNAEIYFITPMDTRKFANMTNDQRVALLVNNCVNTPDDFTDALAVTVLGKAQKMLEAQQEAALPIYLEKHPYLQHFARSASSAMFSIKITGFTLVQQFQNVSYL
jgi:nitroimidazol reductase NimA-like FMN-containing flavoprotein (pyridoxamine 5'-phosphate oxidase superfamily)